MEPAKANHAVNEIPSLFHFESSDSRVASRFFSDLPWIDDKAKHVVDFGNPLTGVTSHPDSVQEKIENKSQDNRIASFFFSELPWVSNDSLAEYQTGFSKETLVEKPDVARDDEIPVAITTPNRVEPNAKLFFSDLPWSKETDKSVKSLTAAETTLSSEVEFRAEKTITISLKDSKSENTKNTDLKQAENAKAFFLRLPWENSKNTANGFSNTFTSNDLWDESLIATNEVICLANDVNEDNSNSTANSFFSQLPWLKAGLLSAAEINSGLVTDKFQPTEEAITSHENPLSGYFQSLPWQGSQAIKQAPENFRSSVQNDSEATGIFALAAQSAIRASQKVSAAQSEKNSHSTEIYFNTLPWKGSR
ncbi:MAG: hypothetical protein IPN42_05090 [Methylococcaceae bacterium]|nr:hypothetical protein [Methylococcaceae bacterium]